MAKIICFFIEGGSFISPEAFGLDSLETLPVLSVLEDLTDGVRGRST